MKEDMLEVLIYLFQNYIIDGVSLDSGQDKLTEELVGAGFPDEEIDKAFIWLEDLLVACEQDETEQFQQPASNSIRIFTSQEAEKLKLSGQSLLMRLCNIGY